jgi:hypothetical protein
MLRDTRNRELSNPMMEREERSATISLNRDEVKTNQQIFGRALSHAHTTYYYYASPKAHKELAFVYSSLCLLRVGDCSLIISICALQSPL